MSTGRPDPAAVRQLMKLAGAAPGGRVSDRELLDRFVRDRSESAFAELMARHGPMVLAVCRRHLRDPHGADDAFQATFIVLARRAGTVKWRESIGGWLFEVAARVAKKAAARAARRTAREGGSAAAPEPAAPAPPPPADLGTLQAALDEELRNLPEKLRAPVVLCHLEGLSQDEVARHLGVSDGQLRGRLYRAKERLRERLLRRGFTLSAVLLALTIGARAQAVPAVLAAGTLRLVGTAPHLVPTAVHHLALGVIRDMTTTLKTVAALALFGALGLLAAGFAVRSALADAPQLAPDAPPVPAVARAAPAPLPRLPKTAPQPVRADDDKKDEKVTRVECSIKSVDPKKPALVVKLDEGGTQAIIDFDPKLANALKVQFAGKPVKFEDLKAGMRAELIYPLEAVTSGPVEVRASWPKQHAVVKAVNLADGSFSALPGGDEAWFEVVLKLAPGATVVVDGIAAGLADLPVGRKLHLELTIDKKAVSAVEADGEPGDLPAVVKSYDPAAQTLLVEFEATANDRERPVTLALPVTATAKVRLAGADAKLTDLKERMPVRLKLTADRKSVAAVLAGPPLPIATNDD